MQNKENVPISKAVMDIADIDEFLSRDINLFPEFGPTKTRSSNERKETICKYKKQIESLRAEIVSLESSDGLNVSYDTSEKKFDVNRLGGLESEVIKFKENLVGLSETANKTFTFDRLESTSTNCDQVLGTLAQVIH